MSDPQPPNAPNAEHSSTTPSEREPWTTPTLETMDVVGQTAAIPGGVGFDGGSPTALS